MKRSLPFILLILWIYSCSSDDIENIPPEEPPVEGAYTKDNQWIYAQMNRNYLWRTDMPDSLSCDYTTDPVTFYKSLLSPADRFSYCSRNTYYKGETNKLNWGFAYQNYRNTRNETFMQVLYLQSETLRQEGLHRGDWLKRISQSGECTVFQKGVMKGDTLEVSDTITVRPSFFEKSNTVYLDSIYDKGNIRIGYLCYLEYDDIKDLVTPLKEFYDAQVDELILDLRYNPGGYVKTSRYLCNSIVSEQGYTQVFQECSYNDILSCEFYETTGESVTREYYEVPSNNSSGMLGGGLYGLNLKKLYILTSQYTASASEATIMCLRPYMDVVVIGETTYGKGVGSWLIADDRYKYQLQPVTLRYYNVLKESTPDSGIPADFGIPGGYNTVKKELGDISEPLLAKALELITGEVIPETETRNVSGYTGLSMVGEPSFFEEHKLKKSNI